MDHDINVILVNPTSFDQLDSATRPDEEIRIDSSPQHGIFVLKHGGVDFVGFIKRGKVSALSIIETSPLEGEDRDNAANLLKVALSKLGIETRIEHDKDSYVGESAEKIVDRLLEDDNQYKVFRHYYESADTVWEGWSLQGPGLESHYNEDGYAQWGRQVFRSSQARTYQP